MSIPPFSSGLSAAKLAHEFLDRSRSIAFARDAWRIRLDFWRDHYLAKGR